MKKIVVLLTAGLLLLGLTISVAAQMTPKANVVEFEDLDYSANLKKAGSIYMGDVLAQVSGVSVSEAEKAYIRYKYSGQNALYYTKPTIVGAQHEYDGEAQRLTLLLATDYYSVAEKGKDVLWTPSSARYGDSQANFEHAPDVGENYYRVVLDDVTWSQNLSLIIEYSADFAVTDDTLNHYLNFAYEKVLLLDEEYEIYEADTLAYQAALDAYNANRAEWEAYDAAMDEYELYLKRVALYPDYLKYQDFLVLVDQYNAEYAAYQANDLEWKKFDAEYAKYREYLEYKAGYPGLLQQHEQDLDLVAYQLYLLSLLEVKDPTTGISFIDMMIDDRIPGMIESKRNIISNYLGNAFVDEVTQSSKVLEKFCREYQALTTDQERYDFYIKEHASFVKHTTQLNKNIKKMYSNDAVYKILVKDYPEYVTTLVRLMAMLHVQTYVFSDQLTLDINAVVDERGGQTVRDLVHPSVMPEKDNRRATPFAKWPEKPADPETFEVKQQPTAPAQRLEQPIYPALPEFSYVGNVNEIPSHMEEPGEMAEPVPPTAQLDHPGAAPALAWEQLETDLYNAYVAGELVQRDALGEDQVLKLTVATNCNLKLDDSDRGYFVHFYNTDEQGTYLGHTPTGVYYGEPATIPEEFASASRPPVNEWAFEFVEWVDEDGEPLDLSCMTSDVNAYASYKAVPRICTVTWDVGDTPVVQYYAYGEMPVYDGPTDRSPSAQYIYHEFLGWDKTIVPVTDDVVYTAQYSTTINKHKVTFIMGDGTSVEKEYAYGWNLAEVVASFPTPYRNPDVQYTYTFKGWSDGQGNFYTEHAQFPILEGPVTFTSEFDKTVNSYTITWIVDGEQTQTVCPYGEIPVFGGTVGVVPYKQPTEQITYTFVGWDRELAPVTGDAAYTANFVPGVRYYSVDFVVEGQVFTFELEYEQVPSFDGTPIKESDVQYDYTFIGWDREPVPVRDDAVYTAKFLPVLRKYPVKFVVGGSEVIAEFEYGKVPKYPNGTPSRPDDTLHHYVFVEWDHELVAVDGTPVTYTAMFTPVPLAPGADGEKGKLTIGADGAYELALKGSQADLSLIFDKAGREQAEVLEVMLGEAVIVFPKAQIDAFYLMGDGIGSVSLAPVEHEGRVAYKLELLDKAGNPVSYLVTELTIKLPYKGAHSGDVYGLHADGTQTKLQAQHEGGYLVLRSMELTTFVIVDKFLIEKNPAQNGVFDAIGEAYEGDVVTIVPDPDEGYHVDAVLVECDGKQIKVESADGKYTFVMPRGNVSVTTTFKVVEGGTAAEVVVGVVTALLIVVIGFVIATVLRRRKSVKI